MSKRLLIALGAVVYLSSCGALNQSSDNLDMSEISIPEVESTSQNKEACWSFTQPKSPAFSDAMTQTIRFYEGLALRSSGTLSRAFSLMALRTSELAPYYNADQYPPEEIMSNLQGTTLALELLCEKVLRSSPTENSSVSTSEGLAEGFDEPEEDSSSIITAPELPYRTQGNRYWNALCPKNLRPNEILPIVYCDMGEGIKHVQRILGINPDGYFGNNTFNALLDFQSTEGLPITGDIDIETWVSIDPLQTGPGTDLNNDGLITPDEFD
jgi:hypothetical protein